MLSEVFDGLDEDRDDFGVVDGGQNAGVGYLHMWKVSPTYMQVPCANPIACTPTASSPNAAAQAPDPDATHADQGVMHL